MLKYILGKAGSGKTAVITDEIRAKIHRGEGDILMLVPEQFSHECERELCAKCGDTLSLYASVTSFKYLMNTLQNKYGGIAGEYLDNGGRLLCMALATRNVAPDMRTFVDAARSPELQNSLLCAIDEMKATGISAQDLREGCANLKGELCKKVSDLALIYEAYTSIVENGHADPADTMGIMAKQIENHGFGKGKTIYVDGFSGFTVSELLVLKALLKTGAELTMCLTMDSLSGGDEVFTPTRITALELMQCAKSLGIEVTTEVLDNEGKKAEPRYVQCLSVSEECEYAAFRCLNLLRETKCRYRDIAIAVRGFGEYKAILQSVFNKYKIPLLISERNSIASRPLPTMISCAYDIILGGWNSDDVISFIGTGLAPMTRDEADELTHALHLRRILEREKPVYLKAFEKASKAAETAKDHIEALAALLEDMNLSKRFNEKAEEYPEYLQMWDLVSGVLQQFNAILGESEMDADEFSRLIKIMLSKYDIGLIPASVDSVSAGDFDRMRKRNIKHLLILGASEGRLPMGNTESGIFTSDEKEELFRAGMVPEVEMESALWRESFLIYNCLNLPSETILFTYSGKPSPVLPEPLHPARFDGDKAKSSFREYLKRDKSEHMVDLEDRANRERGTLSPKSVKGLYGDTIRISASKADQYYSCKYAYFCTYGLGAKKWEKEELTAAEMGTFVHYVLEHVIRDGISVSEAIEKYVHEEMEDLKDKSERYVYLFNRLEKDVERIVEDSLNELKNSAFRAEEFEYRLPGYGIADRIDSWEHDGKKYIRVVDYKTGTKKFELSDIYYGKNMQMLMYLDALVKEEKDVEAAGVMYIPAKDKYISAPSRDLSEEELEKLRSKSIRRSGLLLNEQTVKDAWETTEDKVYTPAGSGASKEQFEKLYAHIQRRLSQMAEGIQQGQIEAHPYYMDANKNACEFCNYASTCGFVDGEKGEEIHILKKIKDDDVWKKMEEEKEHE